MRQPGCTVSALLLSLAAPCLASESSPRAEFRVVPMEDVDFDGAADLAASVASGSARVELPFTLTWEGERYESLEIGAGWVRAVSAGEVAAGGHLSAIPAASAADTEARRSATPGPRFDVYSGEVVLAAGARVLVARDAFHVAVRWWGLKVAGASGPVAAELVIGREGTVRFQYLQVHGLVAGPGVSWRGSERSDPTLALRNGLAVAVRAPDRRLALSLPQTLGGQPPVDCTAPTETWCDQADGANGNARIYFDSRFEETPIVWSQTSVPAHWHLIDYGTCTPGATTTAGFSAYVGDNTTCSYGPLISDELVSASFGPVSATTEFTFSARMGFNYPLEHALLLANGIPLAEIDPAGTQTNLWYNFNPISLAAFAGQMVALSFRFTADIAPRSPGWMVDDVFVYDKNGADARCVREAYYDAGKPTFADCTDTVHDNWAFNESDYCVNCPYTFYVLVECGTAMHLPLWDMEAADLRISNVVSGQTPSLRCRAANGAFDLTDNQGPGHVSFGTPACSSTSGGNETTSDCFVSDNAGLCGIYRLDVTSGGFIWNLFANCAGDSQPGFKIYTSCSDAWAAYSPLPELAVSNFKEVGLCPNTQLEFTLSNLGCVDWPGDVLVRASSTCPGGDPQDWVISGGVPANTSRTQTEPYAVSCAPATVTLVVDPPGPGLPKGAIDECSESSSAAKCSQIPGADSIQHSLCTCTANLNVDAGLDVALCQAQDLPLSGALLSGAGCQDAIQYRWLNPDGTVARDWLTDPAYLAPVACPSDGNYRLEAKCNNGLCTAFDTTHVSCNPGLGLPDAAATAACPGQATTLTCGTPTPGATYEWDFEDDGTYDSTGCTVNHVYPGSGSYTARAKVTTPSGCASDKAVPVTVMVDSVPAEALALRLAKKLPGGIELSWSAVASAGSYRVARGTLKNFYNHTVDDTTGVGKCDTGAATILADSDDLSATGSFYYLVAALSGCGTQGDWGAGSLGPAHPKPIPTASCP